MLTNDAKNLMLDKLFDTGGITHFSLHTDYSASGANEASGGTPAYARLAISTNSAASGSKALASPVTFDVYATTYKWLGYWTALSSGTFMGMTPLGGAPKEYVVDTSTDVFSSPSHGLSNGDMVVFYGGTTVPGGLTAGTIYYVVNSTTSTFKVSATLGGAAIDITSTGTYNCVVSKIVPQTFVGQGNLTIPAYSIDLTTL